MRPKLLPDDLIVAVFHGLEGTAGGRTLTGDRQRLHEAFRQLQPDYPELLSGFRFRNRDGRMESDALDQALSNLEASGLLRRCGTSPTCYEIQPQLDKNYDRFVSPVLRSRRVSDKVVKTIARQLKERLEC